MLALLLLPACGDERASRDPEAIVSYAGYIFEHPQLDDVEVERLAEGTVTFTPVGAEAIEAAPLEDYPGYWTVELPRAAAFSLRIEAEGSYPTVWAGVAPGAAGLWFSGALTAADQAFFDAWFAGIELPDGGSVSALGPEGVHVWGRPFEATGWECADVAVNGAPVICYALGEDGAYARVDAGPFDFFYAFNLPPGDIVVDGGRGPAQTYPTLGGEVVMAWWLLPEDS